MPPLDSALSRPGIIKVIRSGSDRVPLGTCGRCQRVMMLSGRDLCSRCHKVARESGELADYGYVKADRLEDYAVLRSAGLSIKAAARRMRITERTGQRYENELAAAGKAPWRRTDPNVLARHRIRRGAA